MENQQHTEALANQALAYAQNLIISQKTPVWEAKKILIEQGYDECLVDTIIANIQQQREANLKAAKRNIAFGAVWLLGGLIVTIGSYALAVAANGGRYVATYGLIIFGAIQLIIGLVQHNRFKYWK